METILMARARVGVFPKEEGMMQHSGKVFPSIKKPRLSNQKENHPTPNKQLLHTNIKSLQPTQTRGCQSLGGKFARLNGDGN